MNRETHGHRARKTTDTARVASGLNALAGLWVFFSPWIFGFAADAGATWSSVIAGLIILSIGAARAFSAGTSPAWSWINLLIGLWVVITPWLYGHAAHAVAVWNGVIAGLIVAALALTSALITQTNPHGHAAV